MTQNFDSVVFLAPFRWQPVWQSTHYLAEYFSRRTRVLYVELPPSWSPGAETFHALGMVRMLGPGKWRDLSPSLRTMVPRSLPLGRLGSIRRQAAQLYAEDVRRAAAALDLRNPLYWTFDDSVDRIDQIGPAVFVYQCLDLYHSTEQEREITRRASVVFGVSEALIESHRSLNPRCYLMPNGVDTELFRPLAAARQPHDIGGSRPLIGYTGTISSHMDLCLVERLARACPCAQVVMIGPVLKAQWGPQGVQRKALERLKLLKNVRFLGTKPVNQLPGYIQALDVCLLPEIRDDWSRHADPLKLLQYLAMGKPTVATAIPAVQAYAGLCYPADSAEAFVHQAVVALSEPPRMEIALKRRHAAEARRWDVVVSEACRVLSKHGYNLDRA
jgi:glycosyltransferase involved in cell wall biosynthesis